MIQGAQWSLCRSSLPRQYSESPFFPYRTWSALSFMPLFLDLKPIKFPRSSLCAFCYYRVMKQLYSTWHFTQKFRIAYTLTTKLWSITWESDSVILALYLFRNHLTFYPQFPNLWFERNGVFLCGTVVQLLRDAKALAVHAESAMLTAVF